MNALSAIAIFFITWWICLFIVLPFGVRNSYEEGEAIIEGNDTGAPVKPMLARKALITTALAIVVFAIIYSLKVSGNIGG
jgi:predicted secreted protein